MPGHRDLFPIARQYVYLNHAGVAPASTRVRDAVVAWMNDLVEHGVQHEERWEEDATRVRALCARAIGAKPSEIAFVRNTSHGLGLVAEGLTWQEGDEVAVCASVEYPSNVYVWQHLADRGVRVREIAAERGGVTLENAERAINARTRVLAVSSVQYATGHRTDLAALGRLCRERGVLLCVDGIQSVGAAPIDVKSAGVHFLSADSHKWMLGMPGTGFLFVDESVQDRLRPVLVGWKSMTGAWDFNRVHFELRRDAAVLEEGSPPYALINGMGAALALLEEVGYAAVEKRISSLLTYVEKGLAALGCECGPLPAERAGMLLFAPPPGRDVETLARRLADAKISVSLRRGRIRVSPHFWNDESDLDAVVECVRGLTSSR